MNLANTDSGEMKAPRPTDWGGKDKLQPVDLTKHLPLGVAMILSAIPGLVALFSDRPTRGEVAAMVSQGPYSRDESYIKATLVRIENNHSEVSRNSVELSKAIVSVTTQMTLITTELQSLRKDIATMREWWFLPPKKDIDRQMCRIAGMLLWPAQAPFTRLALKQHIH